MKSDMKPDYYDLFSCMQCGIGFYECLSFAPVLDLKCCKTCYHPERWTSKGMEWAATFGKTHHVNKT